jgi:hypothetical protein
VPTLSNAARDAAIKATTDLLDAGAGAAKIRIYSGTKPAGPDTAITSQTLLAEFTLADPAFSTGTTGVRNVASAPRTTTGVAAGTAAWARALDSNNVAVVDYTVGTSAADIILNTVTVSVGLNLELTSGSMTQPA